MIEFEGLEELTEKLEAMADLTAFDKALKKSCLLVERSARKNAPRGKEGGGDLRRSIENKVENHEGIVFSTLEYAPYVEYGTGLFAEGGNGRSDVPWTYQDEKGNYHTTNGIKPMPYMRPALNENINKILELLRESLKDD